MGGVLGGGAGVWERRGRGIEDPIFLLLLAISLVEVFFYLLFCMGWQYGEREGGGELWITVSSNIYKK